MRVPPSELVHRVINALVHGLDAVGDVDLPLELAGLMDTGLGLTWGSGPFSWQSSSSWWTRCSPPGSSPGGRAPP